MTNNFPDEFVRLEPPQRAQVLLALALEMTIQARASYDSDGEQAALRASNEFIHRLVGHARRILLRDTVDADDLSFMSMVTELVAEPGLGGERLLIALALEMKRHPNV